MANPMLPNSGMWTRGNLADATYSALDRFLHNNGNVATFYYALGIEGLGANGAADGNWEFYIRVDLATDTESDAKSHTKLPQASLSFRQPHPSVENTYI